MSQRSEALDRCIDTARQRLAQMRKDAAQIFVDVLDSAESGDPLKIEGDQERLFLVCRAYNQQAGDMGKWVNEVNEIEKEERQAR